MKRDLSKDKIFDLVLIRIGYESLNSNENFDPIHEKTLKLALPVTYV